MRLDEITSFGVGARALSALASLVPGGTGERASTERLLQREAKLMKYWWNRWLPTVENRKDSLTVDDFVSFFAGINYGNSAQQVLDAQGIPAAAILKPDTVRSLIDSADQLIIAVLSKALENNPTLWFDLAQRRQGSDAADSRTSASRTTTSASRDEFTVADPRAAAAVRKAIEVAQKAAPGEVDRDLLNRALAQNLAPRT